MLTLTKCSWENLENPGNFLTIFKDFWLFQASFGKGKFIYIKLIPEIYIETPVYVPISSLTSSLMKKTQHVLQ